MHALIIEDDEAIARQIGAGLGRRGAQTTLAHDLATAREHLADQRFDVIVLDRMLPDGDGLEFLRVLRDEGNAVPVLVLSALGDVGQRVEGLEVGSDDYLAKPFDLGELAARVEALERRAAQSFSTRLAVGDLAIDVVSRRVTRAGRDVRLKPREFELLEFLARHSDQVVTRRMLLESVWGLNFDPGTNVVDVHISRLRDKIDREFDTPLLHTVRGEGYRLATAG